MTSRPVSSNRSVAREILERREKGWGHRDPLVKIHVLSTRRKDELLRLLRAIMVGDGLVAAGLGEFQGRGPANPARAAGDECSFS